jgi:hypothetical protein
MVEHFSKWIERVSLSNKSNEGTIYAFLDWVLSQFGALTNVFINQNVKFLGKFQMLCEQALIDHWTTSCDYQETNGLAKKVVQIVKFFYESMDCRKKFR